MTWCIPITSINILLFNVPQYFSQTNSLENAKVHVQNCMFALASKVPSICVHGVQQITYPIKTINTPRSATSLHDSKVEFRSAVPTRAYLPMCLSCRRLMKFLPSGSINCKRRSADAWRPEYVKQATFDACGKNFTTPYARQTLCQQLMMYNRKTPRNVDR